MQKLINRGHAQAGFTLIELLVVIAIIGILAGIVLASLGTARGGANDAKIKEQLSSLRTAMETYYSTNSHYGPAAITDGCSAAPAAAPWNTAGVVALADEDNYPAGNALVCYTSGSATNGDTWAASAALSTAGQFWCVDSSGASKQTAAAVTAPAAVANDVACP